MSKAAILFSKVYCDFCKAQDEQVLALYDGKTYQGAWASMCLHHFRIYGTGLGTGRGQKLLYYKES